MSYLVYVTQKLNNALFSMLSALSDVWKSCHSQTWFFCFNLVTNIWFRKIVSWMKTHQTRLSKWIWNALYNIWHQKIKWGQYLYSVKDDALILYGGRLHHVTNMNNIFPQTGHVVHKLSNKCLDRAYKQSMDDVFVADCANTITQQWLFDHYNSLWGPCWLLG